MNLRALTIVRTGRPIEIVFIGVNGKAKAGLTRSLRGIHARADVNNKADLTTKFSNIPSAFLRDFLSLGEEETVFE